MKYLKCDLCAAEFQGETFDEWLTALMPHYTQAHADVMNNPNNGPEQREKWMADNQARFDAA